MDDYQGEAADQREYEYLEILWREEYDPVFNGVGFYEMKPTEKSKSENPFKDIK